MNSKLGKSERGEVSVGQCELQRWSVREVPRTIGAPRRARGVLRSDAALAELSISGGASLPLFPDHRPKSTSEPWSQFLCRRVRNDLSPLSLEFETGSRSPEVSSTAFDAQPLDLHSVPLMD